MSARFDIRHGQVYDTRRNIYVPIGDLYSIANKLTEKLGHGARFDILHGQVYDTLRNIYVPIGDLYSIANSLQEKVDHYQNQPRRRKNETTI